MIELLKFSGLKMTLLTFHKHSDEDSKNRVENLIKVIFNPENFNKHTQYGWITNLKTFFYIN